MLENKPNKHGPCKDKKCSFCCNPIAINHRAVIALGEDNLPKDKDGNPLFTNKKEFLFSKDNPDTEKFQTFECKNFDKDTGLCKDYENRPDLCRNTSCIDSNQKEKSEDEQHEDFINKFEK